MTKECLLLHWVATQFFGPLKGLGNLVGNDIFKDLAAPVSYNREKVLLFISTFNLGLILSP
jgi:hypothetical protein